MKFHVVLKLSLRIKWRIREFLCSSLFVFDLFMFLLLQNCIQLASSSFMQSFFLSNLHLKHHSKPQLRALSLPNSKPPSEHNSWFSHKLFNFDQQQLIIQFKVREKRDLHGKKKSLKRFSRQKSRTNLTLLIDVQALREKMHSKRLDVLWRKESKQASDMKGEKRLTPRSLFRLITAHLLHNEIVFYRDAKSMTFNTVATFIILFLPRFIRTWIYEWFVWFLCEALQSSSASEFYWHNFKKKNKSPESGRKEEEWMKLMGNIDKNYICIATAQLTLKGLFMFS